MRTYIFQIVQPNIVVPHDRLAVDSSCVHTNNTTGLRKEKKKEEKNGKRTPFKIQMVRMNRSHAFKFSKLLQSNTI